MTFSSDAVKLIEEGTCHLPIKHDTKIQNKRMWKSLRKHILSRREKSKQGKFKNIIISQYSFTVLFNSNYQQNISSYDFYIKIKFLF